MKTYDLSDLRLLHGHCLGCNKHETVCALGDEAKCLNCGAQYRYGVTVEVLPFRKAVQEIGVEKA